MSKDLRTVHEYLVSGYIRENHNIPSVLNEIFRGYLGNFLLRFDTGDTKSKSAISDDGTVIDTRTQSKHFTTLLGCSLGMNTGINRIRILLEQSTDSGVIGIMSDLDECNNPDTSWMYQLQGYKYWWLGHNQIMKTTIIAQNDLEAVLDFEIEEKGKTGDIIMIEINCEAWTVRFYLNDPSY